MKQIELDEKKYPAKYEVCWKCQGTGTHVHEALSCPSQEYLEDPDFMEEYWAGHHDVICTECKGKRVLLEIDWDNCTTEQKEEAQEYYDSIQYLHAEEEAERRMGA